MKKVLIALAAAGVAAAPAWAQSETPAPVTVTQATFDADLAGWETADSSCEFVGLADAGGTPFCAVGGGWNATDKAAETTFEPLVNAGHALVGRATLRSPEFTVPAGEPVGTATLSVDRRALVEPLVGAGGSARWSLSLVEAVDGATPVELLSDELTAGDAAWVTRTVKIDGSKVVAGRTYRLQATSEFTSDTAEVLGSSAIGLDNVSLTVLPPLEGPKGADGTDGADGDDGAAGRDGEQGAAGSTGATGAAGDRGVAGAPGASGTQGAAGSPGTPGEVRTIIESRQVAPRVNSAEARRLLRIDRLTKVRFSGPFANQMRLRILCRTTVLSRCEGTVKVRSVRPINTALQNGRKRVKRVTLGTGEYQLARRQVGYAKVFLTPQMQRLVRARQPVAVTVQVTVLDQQGRQQRLQRTFRVVA